MQNSPIPAKIALILPTQNATTGPLQAHVWHSPASWRERVRSALASAAWHGLRIRSVDRSLPRPIRFAWRPLVAPLREELSYQLHVINQDHETDQMVVSGLVYPFHSLSNLRIGASYRWWVIAQRHQQLCAISPQRTLTTSDKPPRWIRAPGMTNLRDVGGWPTQDGMRVRQGVVYRGSEMNTHLQIKPAGERVLVNDLGIRTDVDLRGLALSENPQPALDPSRVQWLHVPSQAYDGIVTPEGKAAALRVFQILANASHYPLLFHCWGGADRVGSVAFVLLAFLGVCFEDLCQDYELTSLSIWGVRSRQSDRFQRLLSALAPYGPRGNYQAQAGSYLRSLGLSDTELDALQAQLTVSPSRLADRQES